MCTYWILLTFFQEEKHQTANFQHLSCIKTLSGKKPLDLILYFQFYVPVQLILQIHTDTRARFDVK